MSSDRGNLLSSIFNLDNGVMRFFSRVYDIIILNLIFIACCIPIVTIGAAATSLYSITLKMVKNEESHIIRGFLKAFKQNLKQGSIMGIIAIIIIVFITIDLKIIGLIGDTRLNIIKVLCYGAAIWVYIIFLYAFPILSRFSLTIKQVLKNSFILSIMNLKWTALLILLNLPYVAMLFYSGISMMLLFAILIIFGFSTLAFVQSFIFRKIFDKYEDFNEN